MQAKQTQDPSETRPKTRSRPTAGSVTRRLDYMSIYLTSSKLAVLISPYISQCIIKQGPSAPAEKKRLSRYQVTHRHRYSLQIYKACYSFKPRTQATKGIQHENQTRSQPTYIHVPVLFTPEGSPDYAALSLACFPPPFFQLGTSV